MYQVIFRIAFIGLFISQLPTTAGLQASEDSKLSKRPTRSDRLPNVVIIFVDDLGYADIGAFGSDSYPTPNLDAMAERGRKFTDFVASSAVCSASRAALLTGCYHNRIGISGALGPRSKSGIHENEMTIAELCKQKNYATACFGKWHLGWQHKFLPLQHGFDHYFGLPYSNDMWPLHPNYADLPANSIKRKENYPDLPLFDGNEIFDAEVTGDDQKQLTTQYTERAVAFINENADSPFFLYVPHSMVHVPLFVSNKFAGRSGAGMFGDVMMEVDWSVGQIASAITANGLEKDTLLIFTSDNGPWLSYGDHAGSAGKLREGKGTMFEGGYRVPCLMEWTGRIPAGTSCNELAATIDIFPTVAELINGNLPEHKIDGKDIWPLMAGEQGARSPHESFACYYGEGQLQAVRDRQFKLVLPHKYRTLNGRPGGSGGSPTKYDKVEASLSLYNLANDVSESKNVADQHPQVVDRLMEYAEKYRSELGDSLTNRSGTGNRQAGRVE
jgi:arylsulfatase A